MAEFEEKLDAVIKETERFLERARTAQDARKNDIYERKCSAAAKRASMDLTRALTEFRRS